MTKRSAESSGAAHDRGGIATLMSRLPEHLTARCRRPFDLTRSEDFRSYGSISRVRAAARAVRRGVRPDIAGPRFVPHAADRAGASGPRQSSLRAGKISFFGPRLAKTIPKRSRIPGVCTKIPCAGEQGIFSAEQGIKSARSEESREFTGGWRCLPKRARPLRRGHDGYAQGTSLTYEANARSRRDVDSRQGARKDPARRELVSRPEFAAAVTPWRQAWRRSWRCARPGGGRHRVRSWSAGAGPGCRRSSSRHRARRRRSRRGSSVRRGYRAVRR